MRTATSLSTTNPIWNHHWQFGVRIVLQQSLRLQLTQQNPLSEAPDLVMLSEVGYYLSAVRSPAARGSHWVIGGPYTVWSHRRQVRLPYVLAGLGLVTA
jgi:hypothetical protein